MNSSELSSNDLIIHILETQQGLIKSQGEEIKLIRDSQQKIIESQILLDQKIKKEVSIRSTLVSLLSSSVFSGILYKVIETYFN